MKRLSGKKKEVEKMKKALFAILAVSAVSVFAGAFVNAHNHKQEEGLTIQARCQHCRGTGFQGNWNCFMCKGTGRNSSY